MPIPFIGERMSRTQFKSYLEGLTLTTFKPRTVTLHHTASPNLAQRPNGFSPQHLANLRHYYEVQLGWSGAPHVFVDDQEDGIIVFQRLDRRGVHAKSFNSTSWGLEMLGFFDVEPFDSGRGAAVRDNSMHALALICGRLGVPAQDIKFHRDDPLTSKSCPGRLVRHADVFQRVAAILDQGLPPDLDPAPGWPTWTLTLPGGSPFVPVHVKAGRPIAQVRALLEALRPGGSFALKNGKTEVEWTPAQGPKRVLRVAELDEAGKAWALVRDLVEAAGHDLSVEGKALTVL